MFSVIFPGQGSQLVGMCSELYTKYNIVKNIFNEADEILQYSLSRTILQGPPEELNKTEFTQPSIFLVSYSIYKLVSEEFNINLQKASYFAGHSLGEYSALACSGALEFAETLKILHVRGKAMQSAVPNNSGGMLVVINSSISEIEKIITHNNIECFIANDNSLNQIAISGLKKNIELLSILLMEKKIKNIKIPVSAPFHCKLMHTATKKMEQEISKIKFKNLNVPIISNVTAGEVKDKNLLPDLLLRQIEGRVRWRESINFMKNKNINHFIEIGPGKVLSNLIRRSDKDLKVNAINNETDINQLNIL